MKKITLTWMLATLLCTLATATPRTVTERDSLGHVKRVIELEETTANGITTTDTLSITTYDDASAAKSLPVQPENVGSDSNRSDTFSYEELGGNIVAIVAIVSVFGMPVLIVFVVVYFRHKKRQAKYRLVQQALASGQPLPEEFLRDLHNKSEDYRTQGISNIFLGIGLCIFLTALTDFSIGSIGLLIMFIGFGKLVIHYTREGNGKQPHIRVDKDEQTGEKHIRLGGIEVNHRGREKE